MDIWFFLSIVSAVIVANAFSFFFFMAAMKCSKLQKNGAKDDELPWWVYTGLAAPPLVAAVGVALLS
jgi:hypothetical protein